MASQASKRLKRADLEASMIRHRFRLKKMSAGKSRDRDLQKLLDQSKALVTTRQAAVPEVTFPASLPVSQHLDAISEAIQSHQVIIVAGETGSGKTTQLPKMCLALGQGVFGTIGHTQPRRVAARTVAARLAEELSVPLGDAVGFEIRFGDRTKDTTLIKVMTDGILLAETQSDRFLEQYDTLIIDEAHERSLNIDFLLGYIKRILPKRPDLKVIITSATIDVARFSKHFGNAPIVEVSGRTYPVEMRYRPLPESSNRGEVDALHAGIMDSLDEALKLDRGKVGPGAALIFLPGEREIREVAQTLRRKWRSEAEILPLYARLTHAEQNKVFSRLTQFRVILATNVAETSLTVPGVRYVIDPGTARISRYSVTSKVQRLPIEPISQASANQRAGRSGRVSDGVCFRLFDEQDFESRAEFTTPEILRTHLAAVLLRMLSLKLGDPAKFPFIERPEQRQFADGFQILKELGAIDNERNLTKIGRQMATLPVDPRLARIMIEAARFGALREILIIVSGLSIQDPRERPQQYQQQADEKHKAWAHQHSDFIDYVTLWDAYEGVRQESTTAQVRKFCNEGFLSFLRMREWRDLHTQLLSACRDMGLKLNRNPADERDIHRALLAGYVTQVAERSSEGDYLGARNRRYTIFPGSSLAKRKPRWIMAGTLVETSRLFARTVAQVEPEWIEAAAAHLVKRRIFDPFYDSKRGQVLCYEEVNLFGVILVKRRLIDYSEINPVDSREHFIHGALIEQGIEGRYPFLEHNLQELAAVEALEAKARKRDLLVESKWLFNFYHERLPAQVLSEIDLKAHLKRDKKLDASLRFDRADVMRRESLLSVAQFPDTVQVGENQLPLTYEFDPTAESDGVSVDIPIALLNQVSKDQLDWLVPGLLSEKCLALIRSLPKSLRRNFVPAPSVVDEVLPKLDQGQGTLKEALAHQLFRRSGVRISASDFQIETLDRHLSMLVRLVDDRGKVVAMGRDLDALFQTHGSREANQQFQHDIEQSGATDWVFGDLAEALIFKQGKIQLKGFPALVDEGASVGVKVFEQVQSAQQSHRSGLVRLYRLRLKDQDKYLAKKLDGLKPLGVFYSARGDASSLLDGIIHATFRLILVENQPDVRNQADFEARIAQRGELFEQGQKLVNVLKSALEKANACEVKMATMNSPVFSAAVDDIRAQLNGLFRPNFVLETPPKWLMEYDRYLEGVSVRLEKLQGNLSRDQNAQQELQALEARMNQGALDEEALKEFQGLMQEFRISLFAQALGTRVPVSKKRLEQALNRSAA